MNWFVSGLSDSRVASLVQTMNGHTRPFAICIAGQVRTFPLVKYRMFESVKALDHDVFMAIAANATRNESAFFHPFSPANVSYVSTPKDVVRKRAHMAHTMLHCSWMIQHAELQSRGKYEWIVRMRTDVFYGFDWGASPVPKQVPIVWSNYVGGCNSKKNDSRRCINDEWNIIPRMSLTIFFDAFLAEYSQKHGFRGALAECPECKLGWILWRHSIDRRPYRVNIPIIRSTQKLPEPVAKPFPVVTFSDVCAA